MLARILSVVALTSFVTTVVVAQTDPIKDRQALLKQYGQVSRPIGGMLKGEAFDLAVVQTALDTYAKNAKVLPGLFPAGSDKGDTAASPAIWQKNDEFKALFAKLEADSVKARTAITDEASFKANMPGVLRTCGTCHDSFRLKK